MRMLPPRPSSSLACCVVAAAALLIPPVAPASDAPPQATAARSARPAQSERAPDAAERAAMLGILKAESAPERAAWFTFMAGSSEGKALADALAAVFREAGWKVELSPLSGMMLKPGVSMLMAEEQPPEWTGTALRAMQASGIEVKSATGYRSYYDEKKRDNPSWPGVPLAKDAAFVIVVGPERKA